MKRTRCRLVLILILLTLPPVLSAQDVPAAEEAPASQATRGTEDTPGPGDASVQQDTPASEAVPAPQTAPAAPVIGAGRRTADNVLSVFPFAVLYGTFSSGYERKITDLVSLEGQAFFHTALFGINPATNLQDLRFDWYGLQFGVLFYPGQREDDGLFLGPLLRPAWLQAGSTGTLTIGFGVTAGYRFRFGSFAAAPRAGFSLDIPVGDAFDTATVHFPLSGIRFEWDFPLSWIF